MRSPAGAWTRCAQSFGGDAAVSVNLDLFIVHRRCAPEQHRQRCHRRRARTWRGTSCGVLLPLNIAQVATVGGFTSWSPLSALRRRPAGLVGNKTTSPCSARSRHSALTVFAPTDDAFGTTFPGGLRDLPILGVLGGHVLAVPPGVSLGAARDTNAEVSALIGGLTFDAGANPPTVSLVGGNSAGIVLTDVGATNGVVHVIDTVLVPNP